MFKRRYVLFLSVLLLVLVGCGSTETGGADNTIKIGVTGGVPERLTNIVAEEAKKEGIDIEVIKFNDWVMPNRSLEEGETDLNMFQTKQFLQQYVSEHKSEIVPIGSTYYGSFGIYSEKHKSIDDIPDGATLGIVNDPVNQWRSLLLYEEAGLIKVKDTDELLTLRDIEENPKNLKFKEIEGPLMIRTLGSIDAGLVSNQTVIDQGGNPKEDAIYIETGNNFPMVLATREENKDNPDYLRIAELYHSDAVKQFIEEKYDGAIILTDDPFKIE